MSSESLSSMAISSVLVAGGIVGLTERGFGEAGRIGLDGRIGLAVGGSAGPASSLSLSSMLISSSFLAACGGIDGPTTRRG